MALYLHGISPAYLARLRFHVRPRGNTCNEQPGICPEEDMGEVTWEGVGGLGGKLSNGLRVRMMRWAVYEQQDILLSS